jgi:hypothetical protein
MPTDNPLFNMFDAINSGLSANKALQAYREGGGSVRNETFRSLYAAARQMLQQESDEATRPLNQRPQSNELTAMPTRNATGVLQRVALFVRDKGSNSVRTIFTDVKSDDGMTRGDAIQSALDDYSDNADQYDEVVLSGVHVGSYRMSPQGGSF